MKYTNFYETLNEAQMRLLKTIVLYDGQPYRILDITSAHPDGIFRVYLYPCGRDIFDDYDAPWNKGFNSNSQAAADYWDKYLKARPECGVVRKMMNSPMFNKFRPFPLGMMRLGRRAYYIERRPNRKSEQGLTSSMMSWYNVGGDQSGPSPGMSDVSYRPEFLDCVLGKHKPIPEVIAELRTNEEFLSAPIAREFALSRGPLNIMFLQYRRDIIGTVSLIGTDAVLNLAQEFKYLTEVSVESGLFASVEKLS